MTAESQHTIEFRVEGADWREIDNAVEYAIRQYTGWRPRADRQIINEAIERCKVRVRRDAEGMWSGWAEVTV